MKKFLLILVLVSAHSQVLIAQTGTVKGVVTDSLNIPIERVSVRAGEVGTVTDSLGNYEIKIPANISITLEFSHISFRTLQKTISVNRNRTLYYSPRLFVKTERIDEVVIRDERTEVEGMTTLDRDLAQNLPAANPGVESILKSLPGVNFNNELSTQYNVRGGSFEENLVYVNGVQVYRPYLVRSGQQEGLSFVNPELTQNIEFSAGGFQAKYGDRMSSVLDITYRNPSRFGAAVEASFMGFSATIEGLSKDQRLKAIAGMRYRDNSLLLNSTDVNANFRPVFTDIQTFMSYEVNERFSIDFLGSYAVNNYDFTPFSRQTNFGTISEPRSLIVRYEGKEEDHYKTIFGAATGRISINEHLSGSLTLSAYNTKEQEYFDILAFYGLGEVDSDFGSDGFGLPNTVQSIGAQLDHARNNLEANIYGASAKISYQKNNHHIEGGFTYTIEDLKDRIKEWQVIDSSGFVLRPPSQVPGNDEPYSPYTGPIVPFFNIDAVNEVETHRASGFVQWSSKTNLGPHDLWFNLGLRMQHWRISANALEDADGMEINPRAQVSLKPEWNRDMLFRLSGGVYTQPPFYREMRDSLGMVRPEVEAQKSVHVVLGHDYSFKIWDRPFKLVSEIYYRDLSRVNPFTIDNVKIRYRARNNAVAYAFGADMRLHGEFVPGTQSWFSLGYLQTEENIDDRGNISRPTDQRLKMALLFQDYVPSIPSLRMYLNLVYNTGVPGGSPSYADPYLYQNRLKDYFRADLGISYVLVDPNNAPRTKWLENFKELSLGLELFNMFDYQNSITNTWVRDISANRYVGIPNYLTGRVLNLKVGMRF